MIRKGILLLFFAVSAQLQAGWITWTNGTPAGVNATGVFAGGSGAYSGTVNAGISNVTDGGADTVPGLDARLYASAVLTPAFQANLPVNPDGSFTALSANYNNSADAYTISLDFSGLTNGYLPAGSLFAIIDLDIRENYRDVTAFNSGGVQITSNWLAALGGAGALLDWFGTDGDQTGSIVGPASSVSAGVYQFLGPNANYNSSLAGFQITQDLRSMTLQSSKSNAAAAQSGTGGSGFAIGFNPVPEPGTMALAGIALCGIALLRRR